MLTTDISEPWLTNVHIYNEQQQQKDEDREEGGAILLTTTRKRYDSVSQN